MFLGTYLYFVVPLCFQKNCNISCSYSFPNKCISKLSCSMIDKNHLILMLQCYVNTAINYTFTQTINILIAIVSKYTFKPPTGSKRNQILLTKICSCISICQALQVRVVHCGFNIVLFLYITSDDPVCLNGNPRSHKQTEHQCTMFGIKTELTRMGKHHFK